MKKVWIKRIRYVIMGNLGCDRSINTYTNMPVPNCSCDFCLHEKQERKTEELLRREGTI